MDDFDKEFPDFDWKNTPAYKHPAVKTAHALSMNMSESKLSLRNK